MDDTTRLHRLVDAVDWGAVRGAMGPASGFGRDLHAWLDGQGQPASVFNDAFHQGTVSPLAEPLVAIALAVLDSDRVDLHRDAMEWLSDAVGGVEAHTCEADGFDQWRHEWPSALRAVTAGVDRLLAVTGRSDAEEVVAAGLSALAWLPSQAEPIGAWLAERLDDDPAGLAPLLAEVDWHRRSAAHADRFAELLGGGAGEALAGAVALARIRRGDAAAAARLLEGLRCGERVACHALTCSGEVDEDPCPNLADAYLLTVFPAGGPVADGLGDGERAALARLVEVVPGSADDPGSGGSPYFADPRWPDEAVARFGLPATRTDLAAAIAGDRRVHAITGPTDAQGRLHTPAWSTRRATPLCWVGREHVAVAVDDGQPVVSVQSLADGCQVARLDGSQTARLIGGGGSPWRFVTLHPSPDGRHIAACAPRRITVWSADGAGSPRHLADTESGPRPTLAWSPTGDACAVAHRDHVEIHPLDGDDVTTIPIRRPGHLIWTAAGMIASRDFAAHVHDPDFSSLPVPVFDHPVAPGGLAATTHAEPVVVMPIPDGGLAVAIHRGGQWTTQTLATPARAQALALPPDGSRLAALVSDTADSCELLVWELGDGEPIGDWRVVGGFPATWPDRLGGYPNPELWPDLGWHPDGRLLAIHAGTAVLLVDVDAADGAAVVAIVRASPDGLVWEAPHTHAPASTSTASSRHAVLQTHPDARPSQVHDPTGVADYWDHVVDPDTVHARLRALLKR